MISTTDFAATLASMQRYASRMEAMVASGPAWGSNECRMVLFALEDQLLYLGTWLQALDKQERSAQLDRERETASEVLMRLRAVENRLALQLIACSAEDDLNGDA
jgi:hypothetical protein